VGSGRLRKGLRLSRDLLLGTVFLRVTGPLIVLAGPASVRRRGSCTARSPARGSAPRVLMRS